MTNAFTRKVVFVDIVALTEIAFADDEHMPYACAYSYCAFACARPEVLATHIKTEHLRGLDNLVVILAARVGTKFVFLVEQTDRGKGECFIAVSSLCDDLYEQVASGMFWLSAFRTTV